MCKILCATGVVCGEEYQWLWGEKYICHYHVNDYAGGYKEWGKPRTLLIGQGNVDF